MSDENFLIFKKTEELIHWRKQSNSAEIGFVPTMGNLHAGHLSLVEKSLRSHDITILSIFVNPKQFGPKEDLDKYPRTLEQDIKLLKQTFQKFSTQKTFVLYAPQSIEEIYPSGFQTSISVSSLEQRWEGAHRPGHFTGVATVVFLLFQLTLPHHAYFGLKDYQQFLILKKMSQDLRLNITLHGMDIIRDSDGLALSSRNQYLSKKGRQQALTLPRTLTLLQQAYASPSLKSFQDFQQQIEDIASQDQHWEYLACCHPETLLPLEEMENRAILLAVYRVDNTRLLDNILLTKNL